MDLWVHLVLLRRGYILGTSGGHGRRRSSWQIPSSVDGGQVEQKQQNIEDRCAKILGDRCAKKGPSLVLCIVCASACPGGGHRGPFPVQAACTQLQRGPPRCCRRPGEVSLNWHKHLSNGAENDRNSCKIVFGWCGNVVVVLSVATKVNSPHTPWDQLTLFGKGQIFRKPGHDSSTSSH